MSSQTFVYSVAADFPDGKINLENLNNEIRASAITIALQGMTLDGDVLTVTFKAVLPSGDKTLLDGDTTGPAAGLIAQHDSSLDATQVTQQVRVMEENGPTGGHFVRKTVVVNADAESTTVYDEPMFVNTTALSIHYVTTREHEGDTINVQVAPDSVVGGITADVNIGDTVINVSATVIEYVFRGPCLFGLSDGVQQESLGRIVSVDTVAKQVTVENAATLAFAAASPTYALMTVVIMRDNTIGPPFLRIVGESKIGGSYVPKDRVVRLLYTNHSPPERLGQITSAVSIGESVINVDAEVIAGLVYGNKIDLEKDGTTSALGTVTRIDKDAGQLTVSGAADADFATPAFVRKTAKKFVADIEMLQ